MWPPGSASQPPPSPATATGLHPAARPVSLQCRLSMCPARSLLLVATLVLLDYLSLARNLSVATPGPEMFPCLHHSQNLLKAASNTLQKARQILEFYPCTSEEIDHEDITKDKTSTVEACLPLELIKNGSCLASRKTSFMMALCLRSIYEDLKIYQVEFKTMNAKLLMDPKRQIFLDQNILGVIDELMQALNFNSETVPQKSSLEEPDFYKTKIKLCILLHAFRIRAVTIDRVMSYLNAS
ncbi:PREDICTED: interleukin-12 subunit alpha isoform X2 [Mandrillus leucophaeus]|uniref:Interleukin-12 subunit alpha n=2 Tax=Cercopithecinae TaxID=9528 RepID=A0A2K5NJD5_CERAT|nr:PREDICTED: interleukin-12 subunit alpha isoform X2 [Mandrillus leucophaeus]